MPFILGFSYLLLIARQGLIYRDKYLLFVFRSADENTVPTNDFQGIRR